VDREHAGAELWLAAGVRLLEEGGVATVKLPALAARVGLTTGSFYHHFRNMTEFLDRLAVRYAAEPALAVEPVATGDPRRRLRATLTRASGHDRRAVGSALRDWAATSDAARQAVYEGDAVVLERLAADFAALGHDELGARARALLAISVGVATIVPPWGGDAPDVDRVLDLLAPRST
jgi:AcrR family transcriptional regulator